MVSTPVAFGISESLDGAAGDWVAMINLTGLPLHFNDWLFGSTSGALEDSKSLDLPRAARVGVFFAVTIVATLLMWNRYRKLSV